MAEAVGHGDGTAPGGLVGRRVLARAIDDGILTAASIGIAVGIGRIWPLDGYDTAAVGNQAYVDLVPLVATLATGLLATVLFLLYVGSASRWDGATLGRAVARIKVVDAGGGPARRSVLFGRELIRVALVSACLALAFLVAAVLVEMLRVLSPDRYGDDLDLIKTTVTGLLPIAVVIAGWVGAALVDQAGRAPHDRLARTRVVRAGR